MTARRLTAFAAAAVVLLPSYAFAQVTLGGGGSSSISAITSWFMTTFGNGLIDLGIIGLAVGMLCMHFRLATIGMVICGCILLANYQGIQSLFTLS